MTTLYASSRDAVTLPEAVSWAEITGVALLASPSTYLVAKADPAGCTTHDGAAVDLSSIFEARLFDPQREMRWWHASGGAGRAIVLGEQPDSLPDGDGEIPPLAAVEVVDGTYLLWGRALADGTAGWTTLSAARIGVLRVPLAGTPPQERVALTTREYVAVEPRYGNAYVAEERLVQFEVANPIRLVRQ